MLRFSTPAAIEPGECFGLLTVVKRVRSRTRGPKYRCSCACGNRSFYAKRGRLENGAVRKCDRC